MKTTKRGKRIALGAAAILLGLAVLIGVAYRNELQFWYEFHRDFESLSANTQGYPEYRHRQTGIVFVRVPGGTFWMGSSKEVVERTIRDVEADGWKYSQARTVLALTELPRHSVTLAPFLIAKYEGTQAEWMRVMGYNPSRRRGDDLPVEMVSWEDCQDFCRKTGLSLPTESQWVHASKPD